MGTARLVRSREDGLFISPNQRLLLKLSFSGQTPSVRGHPGERGAWFPRAGPDAIAASKTSANPGGFKAAGSKVARRAAHDAGTSTRAFRGQVDVTVRDDWWLSPRDCTDPQFLQRPREAPRVGNGLLRVSTVLVT